MQCGISDRRVYLVKSVVFPRSADPVDAAGCVGTYTHGRLGLSGVFVCSLFMFGCDYGSDVWTGVGGKATERERERGSENEREGGSPVVVANISTKRLTHC